jgi:hypothetical protein
MEGVVGLVDVVVLEELVVELVLLVVARDVVIEVELEVDEVDEVVDVDVRIVPVEPGTGTPAWVFEPGITYDTALDGAAIDDCTIDEVTPGADTIDEATFDGRTASELPDDVVRPVTAKVVPDTTVTDEPGFGRSSVR